MKTQDQHQIKPETQSCQMAVSGSVTEKDLRIGNLVFLPSGITYAVDIVYKNYAMLKHWRSIPITEKWLLELGYFIIETNDGVEGFKENHRYSVKELIGKEDWLYCDGEQVLTNIKYIHQLQNIYYSLTGLDLQVKSFN